MGKTHRASPYTQCAPGVVHCTPHGPKNGCGTCYADLLGQKCCAGGCRASKPVNRLAGKYPRAHNRMAAAAVQMIDHQTPHIPTHTRRNGMVAPEEGGTFLRTSSVIYVRTRAARTIASTRNDGRFMFSFVCHFSCFSLSN